MGDEHWSVLKIVGEGGVNEIVWVVEHILVWVVINKKRLLQMSTLKSF